MDEKKTAPITIVKLAGVHIACFERMTKMNKEAAQHLAEMGFECGTAKHLVRLATGCPKEQRPFRVYALASAIGDGFRFLVPFLSGEHDEWDMDDEHMGWVAAYYPEYRYIVVPLKDNENKEVK